MEESNEFSYPGLYEVVFYEGGKIHKYLTSITM